MGQCQIGYRDPWWRRWGLDILAVAVVASVSLVTVLMWLVVHGSP